MTIKEFKKLCPGNLVRFNVIGSFKNKYVWLLSFKQFDIIPDSGTIMLVTDGYSIVTRNVQFQFTTSNKIIHSGAIYNTNVSEGILQDLEVIYSK